MIDGETSAKSPGDESHVRCLIVAPAPLGDARIGGIVNFIRGFVRHMPDDFAAEIVGVAAGDDVPGVGWQTLSLGGRQVRFLAVARIPTARRTGVVPVKLRLAAGLIRARRTLHTRGRVLQFHAPATDIPFLWRRAPAIRVVHNDAESLASPTGGSTWRHTGPLLRAIEDFTFRRMDRVYFVNRASLDEHTDPDGSGADRMRYLSNGVDTDVFHPLSQEERTRARVALGTDLGIPVDADWLLFAGRLDEQKDPELLLRSFAASRALAIRETHLLIAGEGALRTKSEALATSLGISRHVHFLGLVPHERLAELMPAVDLFVITSAYEAAPFVVYEALAAGLPVVSTQVGEVPRIVRHLETGWLAEERTPEAIAAGIRWALDQPRAAIAARCASSMVPYQIQNVLAPFYEDHRRLAALALGTQLDERR